MPNRTALALVALACLVPPAALAAPVARPADLAVTLAFEFGFGPATPFRLELVRSTQVTVDEELESVFLAEEISTFPAVIVPVTATTAITYVEYTRWGHAAGTFSQGGVALQAPGEACPGLDPLPGEACNRGGGFGGPLALRGTVRVHIVPMIVVIPLLLERFGAGGSTNDPFTIDAAAWSTQGGAVDADLGTGPIEVGPLLDPNQLSLVSPTFVRVLGNTIGGVANAPAWRLDVRFLDGLPIPGFLLARDLDEDGVPNDEDNCPDAANPGQEDLDGDGFGDPCDVCPADFDPGQEDLDGNGVGDACNDLEDPDGDDRASELDNCPFAANPDQLDGDGDGVGNVCDNCPDDANADQANADGDPRGDVCDSACFDGLDNDGDGFIDFPDDFGCVAPGFPSENPECRDGIDNDGDGHIDLGDPGCKGSLNPEEDPACDDGIDNDGDGLVDWPQDPGCLSSAGRFETLECDDNIDNDRDGRKDTDDPGCRYRSSPTESPKCSDGIDNEARPDGLIDFDGGVYAGLPPEFQTAPDPECQGDPWRDAEADACGLGAELALLVPWLAAARRRRRLRR